MSELMDATRQTIRYAGRPTDARGLLPLAVARKLLRAARAYPGAPVHVGRTPGEKKDVAASHDLHAALVSLDDAAEVVGHLQRLVFVRPLFDATPLAERFGAAILPWIAGQVADGELESKAWGLDRALAAIGTDEACELLMKVSAIGFYNERPTPLVAVADLPELAPGTSIDVRVTEHLAVFEAAHPGVVARVRARRSAGRAAAPQAPPQAPPATAPRVAATVGPSMAELWQRLRAWAAAHAPELPLALRKPATKKAIAAAEAAMGLTLPADFVESLRVHDGMADNDDDRHFPWLPGCDRLAPLAAIVEQWQDAQRFAEDLPLDRYEVLDAGRFRGVMTHPWRIPIAGSLHWDQDNTFLDLVPGPVGVAGQVVTMVTECDFVVLGASLREALQRWVELLESGAWTHEGPVGRKRSGHSAHTFAKLAAPPEARGRRR